MRLRMRFKAKVRVRLSLSHDIVSRRATIVSCQSWPSNGCTECGFELVTNELAEMFNPVGKHASR
jgi:hypothetical protein